MPKIITVSIPSTSLTFSCNVKIASLIIGISILLATNPGASFTSTGILSNFFGEKAFTTTIPAQLIKKFNIPVVPVYIERTKDIKFKIIIEKPIYFSKDDTIQEITDELNKILEAMIIKKPEQWIWSHNRWK